MKIKQLSALLLAISIAVVPSVSAANNEKKPLAKPHTGTVKSENAKKMESKKKAEAKKKIAQKKKFKKSRGKRPTAKKIDKSIEKIGKFDRNGSIKSFATASNGLIEFMNSKGNKATAAEKMELFREVARFNWITGHKRFDTTAHYEQTVKLLQEARKHSALFGKVKAKFINKWLKEKEEQLKEPKKRVSEKGVRKVAKKEMQKKVSKQEKKQQEKKQQRKLLEAKKKTK